MSTRRNRPNVDSLILGVLDKRSPAQMLMSEIIEETRLPAAQVKKHLRALVRRQKVSRERGKGGLDWYAHRVAR